MSKKILFLFSMPEHKAQLQLCEGVFKAILRKFRQSALFTYLQLDTSLPCRNLMEDLLLKDLLRHDAVFLNSSTQSICAEDNFINDAAGKLVTEHHAAGRAVFFPAELVSSEQTDGCIVQTNICPIQNIQKAAKLAAKEVKRGKHSLTICTHAQSPADREFINHAEHTLGNETHLDIQHIYLNDMISLCMKQIPSFEIVLTREEHAKIIAMHLNTLPSSPTGYLIWHTEKARIYLRQILAYEEMNNTLLMSVILAFAAILENELNMKSAGDWLKRCATLAFEKCAYAPKEDFIREVICEIETPMRKRRVK